MSGRRLVAAVALVGLSLAPRAAAHDFWIEPTKWTPAPGDLIGLHLVVGHQDDLQLVERQAERVLRFWVAFPAEPGEPLVEREIPGAEGRAPAGYLKVERAGIRLVGYRSRDAAIELEPAKFESYLHEEGLEHVIEERTRRGERALPGREAYSRSSKCILRAGADASDAGFDRAIGLALELVPLDDPFALAPGAPLRLRVLHEGRPIAGLLVRGHPLRDWRRVELGARSGEDGVVRFTLPEGERWDGRWLFASVHMHRLPEGAEQDWQSLWASLTFEVPVSSIASKDANESSRERAGD